jgi:hypothetical protein
MPDVREQFERSPMLTEEQRVDAVVEGYLIARTAGVERLFFYSPWSSSETAWKSLRELMRVWRAS